MSGGHFTYCYDYYKVANFADELEGEIDNNNYGVDVINCLKLQVKELHKASEIMKACDYLYSGDHGENSFLERIKEIEEKYV